ncbi:HK97-gp10 family putative phage morphogenesis protein [Clostridium sp. YIM B02506]|uniref:HK97-gp10 family putative phage morphogenesis protein n=1 Tax=Clostridium sp. YIM B02506 TaxID=2910680 RepID=UPI001EED9F81|nr:HK97-gp10 family putative phage morphogenesis protein [Clostridium sp. YIM B02506]
MTFVNNSKACKEAIRKAQVKWLYAAGELLVSTIRPLIPVMTSNLKTSLDYVVDEDKMTLTVGVGEEYAVYVEFGTGEFAENGQGRKGGWTYKDPITGETVFTWGQDPQPYMRPGYRNQKKNIEALLAKYLKELGTSAKITMKKVKK